MDNNNSTVPYSTANKEQFKMEVISLLEKMINQIVNLTSKASASNRAATNNTATSLGVLKMHEYKLNDMLVKLEDMTDTQWVESKEELVKDFDAVHRDFQPGVVK